MNILILEDAEERNRKFRNNLQGCRVEIVDNVERCINLLYTYEWDILFLDHDLGHKVFTPSNKESGYGVACWLETNPKWKPKTVVIHSLNPLGVKKIKQALPEAIVCPFVWENKMVLERILENQKNS